MEDVRKYTFPSLEVLQNKAGRQLEQHKNLPSAAMQDAMDNFVDMMDLEDAGRDEDGYVMFLACS
jgi:ATP-dependent DNA helicase 2 subunit 2